MPNHYRTNVFTIFMDALEGQQNIFTAGTDKEWNGKTSRVLIDPSPVGDVKITLGKPETPGIMVNIGKADGDCSCIVSFDPYGPFDNDADFNEIELQFEGSGNTTASLFSCFWNGDNWIPVGLTYTDN